LALSPSKTKICLWKRGEKSEIEEEAGRITIKRIKEV